jgi:hypothetical protein
MYESAKKKYIYIITAPTLSITQYTKQNNQQTLLAHPYHSHSKSPKRYISTTTRTQMSLRVRTFNVRGLTENRKRQDIFNYLQQKGVT